MLGEWIHTITSAITKEMIQKQNNKEISLELLNTELLTMPLDHLKNEYSRKNRETKKEIQIHEKMSEMKKTHLTYSDEPNL